MKQFNKNSNIDINIEVNACDDDFFQQSSIDLKYKQVNGDDNQHSIPSSEDIPYAQLSLDPTLNICVKFKLLFVEDYTQADKEFKQICKTYHLLITSFHRPLRDILKNMTVSYAIPPQSKYAYIGVKVTKEKHRDELLEYIKEIYGAFQLSEPGWLNVQLTSDASFENLFQGDKFIGKNLFFKQTFKLLVKGSLSNQTYPFLRTLLSYINPSKQIDIFMKLPRINQIQLNLNLKSLPTRTIKMDNYPKKPIIRIPIFQKSMMFTLKYFDQEVLVAFNCPLFNILTEVKYKGNFTDILKAMIDA